MRVFINDSERGEAAPIVRRHDLLPHFLDLAARLNLLLEHTQHGILYVVREKAVHLRLSTATHPIRVVFKG